MPESPADHEEFEAEGVRVFVERQLLEEAIETGRLSFELGLLGRCRLLLITDEPVAGDAGPTPTGR